MSAVTKINVLDKLGFVCYGPGGDENRENLKLKLSAFWYSRDEKLITRQTILYWFSKRSAPSRGEAFAFLRDFFDQEIDYNNLADEQKKVYRQISSFFTSSLAITNYTASSDGLSTGVQSTLSGNVSIISDASIERIEEFAESWQGVYITYRMRLTYNDKKPISREVMRIFRRKKEIIYHHWYVHEEISVERFSGNVVLKRDSVWFFGASPDANRLRICHFRMNNTINPIFSRLRWGLLHSDIPLQSSREPASVRILAVKANIEVGRLAEFIASNVAHVAFTEIDEKIRGTILRAIDNHTSSRSKHRDLTPVDDDDPILQVNQTTLEAMCSDFEDADEVT